jgi:hypothetical protein
MKIKKEHYEIIKKAIIEGLESRKYTLMKVWIEIIETKSFVKNSLVSTIFLIHQYSNINGERACKFVCDNLYNYINDQHLETALMQIAKELIEKENQVSFKNKDEFEKYIHEYTKEILNIQE